MNANAYFVAGKTHSVCQDYAESVSNSCVILADGCSSSPHSDFGARFLVAAAKDVLKGWIPSDWEMSGQIIGKASAYCRAMDLPLDCLCATLLIATLDGEYINTTICGDGVIVARHRNGGLFVSECEYPSGAPFYLRYRLDRTWKGYEKQFGFCLKKTDYYISGDEVLSKGITTYEDIPESIISNRWLLKEYDLVAMFTDGVQSFVKPHITDTSKTEKSVDFLAIIRELLNFKSYTGSFVERRIRRAFDPVLGVFGQKQWINTDDLSMGAIADLSTRKELSDG